MSRTRVYHPGALAPGAAIDLDAEAAHHVTRVLRARVGDEIVLFNGAGGEYQAIVQSATRGSAAVLVQRFDPIERESPIAVTLAQVISSGERMDLTIQKSVELGVARIQPLASRTSKVRLDDARAARRVSHWQRIVIAACEQSGRNRIPIVAAPIDVLEWVAAPAMAGVRLLLSPRATESLSQIKRPASGIVLLVGAEAGLADEEERLAVKHGFRAVRLGPRILRTETAGLTALAATQALWGDL